MPVQTPDTQIGDALTAATVHQMHRTLRGYGWISGGAASPGSGVEVEVPVDTTMWIDGTETDVAVGENTAQLLPHDRWPRWASIVVNDVGEVEAVHGEVDRPLTVPNSDDELTGRQAPRPSPPVITASDRVLHSLVWIPANTSSVQAEHIVDRRVDARVDAYNFTLDTYSDADAVAAVEADDPLDLAGAIDVPGRADLRGVTEMHDTSIIDEAEFDGHRTTVASDYDFPLIYRSGNGSDGIHTSYGHLILQPRTSLEQDIKLLAGSPNPAIALQINGSNQSVEMPNGSLSVSGNIWSDGNRVATRNWTNQNAVRNTLAQQYEIQKDGTDGTGVINFKTPSS